MKIEKKTENIGQELAARYHTNLSNWDKTIRFYMEEIRVLENRLELVCIKNTNKSILANVEHFQNQLILQKEQFDILQHEISEEKLRARADILGKNSLVNITPAKKDHIIENKVATAEKIFRETRDELYRFLTEVL